MQYPDQYKALDKNRFYIDNFSLVPIRFEDRFEIMQWRNEQIYHLRQSEPLTEEMQNDYFSHVVSKLFARERPTQLLFSYLENDKCIGYGGLVHINWIDRNAEISFIMNTELEKNEFQKHWGIYLELLEQLAFEELNLHKIYTYAFDLRPHLYTAIEAKGFVKEATLSEHCWFEGEYKDVVIHSKMNNTIAIRRIKNDDKKMIFDWANDTLTRENSFYSQNIKYLDHEKWFESKIQDKNTLYYICEVNGTSASIVRFDKNSEIVVIGININPDFRGKKLATIFLTNCCKKYFEETNEHKIHAFIKKNNLASIKSFEKAGFILFKELVINGNDALEYTYERK